MFLEDFLWSVTVFWLLLNLYDEICNYEHMKYVHQDHTEETADSEWRPEDSALTLTNQDPNMEDRSEVTEAMVGCNVLMTCV